MWLTFTYTTLMVGNDRITKLEIFIRKMTMYAH